MASLAHPGGIDVYGCHPDDKADGYHCHEGVLAGLNFHSRGETLGMVENWRKAPLGPPAPPQATRPAYDALAACAQAQDPQRRRPFPDRIAPRNH